MILFNTTFCVDSVYAADFIDFITGTYIPLSNTGGLYAPLLTEMRAPAEADINGRIPRTFALQFRAVSEKVLNDFRSDILPEIYEAISRQWGMGVAMFESTLDVIHDTSKK